MSNAVSRAILLVTTLVLAVACGRPAPPQDVTLAKKGTNGALVIAQDGRPVEGAKPLTDDGDAAVPVYTSDAALGNRDALVTLVEFSDLECPYCSRAAATVDALREAYGPDELRVVWKHYPLPFHRHAKPLSEAGAGVLELGGPLAFFRYQRAVFDSQGRLREAGGFDDASARRFAEAVGIDGSVIEAGLRDGRWTGVVERDLALGRRIGVNGTPAFFVCVFRAKRGGRSNLTRGLVPSRRGSERSDGRGQVLVSGSFSFTFERALRIEPPRRVTRCALWTRRSQIASAIVASPMA